MVLKFYLSVAKALKLQVKKSLGLNPTFVKVRKTRGKTLEGLFAPRVNKPENNGLKYPRFNCISCNSFA